MQIYCLFHRNIMLYGDFDEKTIGYYTSYARARLARDCYRYVKGFCDAPDDFHIEVIQVQPGPNLYVVYYNDLSVPYEEVELILGYFGTLEEANLCRERYIQREPFCNHEEDLIIDEVALNRDEWKTGFDTEWV